LVLGTDGLFGDLSSQQVVQYVGEYIDKYLGKCNLSTRAKPEEHVLSAASFLTERALLHASVKHLPRFEKNLLVYQHVIPAYPKPASSSNATSSVEGYLSDLLRYPSPRSVHDDITVMVIFFR